MGKVSRKIATVHIHTTKSYKLICLRIVVDMILVVNVVDWRHMQHIDYASMPRLLVLLALDLVFLVLLLVRRAVLEFYVGGPGTWIRTGLVYHGSGIDSVGLECLFVAG